MYDSDHAAEVTQVRSTDMGKTLMLQLWQKHQFGLLYIALKYHKGNDTA